MTDGLEWMIQEALNGPCGCREPRWLCDCPICLPERVAAAIEASSSLRGKLLLEIVAHALRGEP